MNGSPLIRRHIFAPPESGRKVALLVNGALEAGTHQARFEASELPSGGYIYRLTTPKGELTKMMLLMK